MIQFQGRSTALSQSHLLAVGEALLTALIWASSFVGVKVVLLYTGPFTLAGLRYFTAFLFLFPWLWQRRHSFISFSRQQWSRFAMIVLFQFTIGNSALFFALKTLPATTGALALCLVPIPVLLLGMMRLKERSRPLQLLALAITIGGSVLFFSPSRLELREPLALGLLAVAILSFSAFPVFARELTQNYKVDTITLTGIPLGIGGSLLLLLAVTVDGVPHMPLFVWGLIFGLALINTLLAYLLYNHSFRHLTAIEANVMLNLTPLGTAIIAWATLGERLVPIQITGMVLVVAGASLVQRRNHSSRSIPS